MSALPQVEIFTDGACKGNPGPGGWGAVLRFGETEKEISGGETLTTNNRMEMMAAMQALETLKRPCQVTLYTDSKYVMDGITKWVFGWQKNGWKTADRKPVKKCGTLAGTGQGRCPPQGDLAMGEGPCRPPGK